MLYIQYTLQLPTLPTRTQTHPTLHVQAPMPTILHATLHVLSFTLCQPGSGDKKNPMKMKDTGALHRISINKNLQITGSIPTTKNPISEIYAMLET